ncbi:MAG: ABC transporter permease [Gemmatimonadaceae bacterium]
MLLEPRTWDIDSSLRSVWRARGFSLAVVATLAVGVGGTLATVSVVDGLLFRAPPGVKNGALISRVFVRERAPGGVPRVWYAFSGPDLRDFTEITRASATLTGYLTRRNTALGDSTLRVSMAYVAPNYFNLLGVAPQLGRFFSDEEMSARSSPVAVISDALWRRMFGASRDVLGRTIQVAGAPVTVIGVTAGPFQGIDLEPLDLWMPVLSTQAAELSNRSSRSLEVLAKTGSRRGHAALAANLTTVYRHTRTLVERGDTDAVVRLAPLTLARGDGLLLEIDERRVDLAKRLAAVSVAVLVVTIGNVLVLFLVRTIRRRKELAVRLALGASVSRIAMTLLLEGLILGALAAVAAGISGTWFGALLGSLLLPATAVGTVVDAQEISVACLFSLVIGGLASLTPLLLSPQITGGQALRLDTISSDLRGTQLRSFFLSSQVAVCIALLTIATTFQQSLMRLARTNLGVDREKLITVDATGQTLVAGSVRDAMTRIATLPGVIAVANASADLGPAAARGRFAIPGEPDVDPASTPSYNLVDTAYFRTANILLLHGRALTPSDGVASAAVAVITESMANAFWRGRNPLGECFIALGDLSRCVRVVGVVGDVRWDLSRPPQPHYYMPLEQHGMKQGQFVLVRTRGSSSPGTVREIERIVATTLGTKAKRPRVTRLVDRLDRQIRPWKAAATLFTIFGLLALIASAAGVYATVSYEMAQRRVELGVRLTLGATLWHLVQLVMKAVAWACAAGAAVGILLAVAGGRVIASFLFDTSPANVLALLIAVGTVSLAALLATLAPAWSIMRTSLAAVLRG